MLDITEQFISQCSLTLGQFDSESVNLLVTLFHHQNACSQLILLSNNLKEKFENLLTSKTDDDIKSNDTPLTRIELAIMIHFKQKYFSELLTDNDKAQSKSIIRFSVDDEINLAYCFLLAQIDDRLSEDKLDELKFLLNIRQPIQSLFDIYEKLGENFPKFFSLLIQCQYFARKLVIVDKIIRDFQLFIKRYEDFIITFDKFYKPLPYNGNNYSQTDDIFSQNNTHEITSFMAKILSTNREQIKPPISPSIEQTPKISIPRPITQQSVLSSNVPQKGLCVIINIVAFNSSQPVDTPKRSGSDKDVNIIKIVFNKLNFTILECRYDFKKDDFDAALNQINDKNSFGDFDCLVVFIMSHGLLHSFFTADSKEVIIRDIVRRFTDSSTTTIWVGKPRLFFIQACRSLWPANIQYSDREGVKQSDLSPRMLVAYSCSPNEASKRSPTTGSIFIQIFCIMLLRYGHYFHIQSLLDWTARFVIKRDEYVGECKQAITSIQRPEYIEREFSSNFRFSTNCLFDQYPSWTYDKRSSLTIPLSIWREIYDLIIRPAPTGMISGQCPSYATLTASN